MVLGAVLAVSSAQALAAGSDSSDYRASIKPQASDSMKTAKQAIDNQNYQRAISALRAELQTNPGNADAWNLLGFSSRKSGDFSTAESAYTRALTLDPTHTAALEYMGEMYLSLNQPEDAQALLARLDELCSFNCKHRDQLHAAIAAYQAQQN